MIPNNAITANPVPSRFKTPYDLSASNLSRACRGGVALNDPSKGRDYQTWYVWYADGAIKFGPAVTPLVAAGQFAVANVQQLSMAFDNNMNPVISWLDGTGAHIRYFSGVTSAYVVLDVPGATSCLAVVDDVRSFYNANSDVVFAYTLSTGLWYTYQRENYATPRQVSTSTKKLLRMGMNATGRLQFETHP